MVVRAGGVFRRWGWLGDGLRRKDSPRVAGRDGSELGCGGCSRGGLRSRRGRACDGR